MTEFSSESLQRREPIGYVSESTTSTPRDPYLVRRLYECIDPFGPVTFLNLTVVREVDKSARAVGIHCTLLPVSLLETINAKCILVIYYYCLAQLTTFTGVFVHLIFLRNMIYNIFSNSHNISMKKY